MLAIIIPYYKCTFFEVTLQSLAAQTCQDFKVYIGDDASPEDPKALVEQFHGKFNFSYHRFETNLGGTSLTQQWERCIALSANEPWLMILGDDDVLGDNVVEEFYNNLPEIEEIGSNVIRFATKKTNEFGDTSEVYFHPKIEKSTDFLFRKTRSSLSEYVFKKEKILNIGFKNFPLGWYSDVLAVLEFSDFDTVFTINESLVMIRISSESISGNQDNIKLKSFATFQFYYHLLENKHKKFNTIQQEELKKCIIKSYLNDKKQFIYFYKISKIYLTRVWLLEYVNFVKLLFLNGLK